MQILKFLTQDIMIRKQMVYLGGNHLFRGPVCLCHQIDLTLIPYLMNRIETSFEKLPCLSCYLYRNVSKTLHLLNCSFVQKIHDLNGLPLLRMRR